MKVPSCKSIVMHVVYSFFSDLPTTTRMHIHSPGQHSHQECHQCIHAGVYKGQLFRYDGIRMINCCVIVLKYQDLELKGCIIFVSSADVLQEVTDTDISKTLVKRIADEK